MNLLACQGLTRRPWFEGCDLELEAGEIVFLRGPTGSGKSLFLRTIADLDPCDSGTVSLEGQGRRELKAPEWRRRVLYVHQSAPRLPGTVATNLERIAQIAGVHGTPDTLGLDAAADAERLSGGEGQLLALARAFLLRPRVLLLDESTSAMDAETARRAEARLLELARDGAALLWVSHDEALVERLAGHVKTRVELFP